MKVAYEIVRVAPQRTSAQNQMSVSPEYELSPEDRSDVTWPNDIES